MGGLADLDVQPGLLVDLPHHGVPRVLAVLEAATGQRPELLAGQPLGQPAQQDAVLADDDGVRRDALHLPHLAVRPSRSLSHGRP